MIGTRLAHYEIASHLGSGGMGDVYQATDTKLGRSVAIKFLPETFSHDTERVARFQREARVLASLNHSNIAAVYGVEETDSRHFLVMELVTGETLADRIKRGAIPIEEALSTAKQIAEALEEAHGKGIIHRDLKPANIKVTPEGKVKVLDFGLAKAYEREQTDSSLSHSPTISLAATNAGVILGTAAYMSPEQARGRTLDKRTDIWSLGCVLFEMLTGKQAFRGEDITDVLAAVVKSEPAWDALPADTPSAIRTLLRRCLQKDRAMRLRDAGDLLVEIIEAQHAPPPVAVSSARERKSVRLAWATAAVALLALLSLAVIQFRQKPSAEPVRHLAISLPQDAVLWFLSLSPDGKQAAMVFTAPGKTPQIWLRSLDSLELRPLPSTDNANTRAPFWSPDSKFIGFYGDAKLKVVPATGGPPQVLCEDVGISVTGTWSPSGVILFDGGERGRSLRRVDASGGECKVVEQSNANTVRENPQFLPDAVHFLFNQSNPSNESGSESGLYLGSLDDPKTSRRLLADRSSAVFVPSTTGKDYGYLLFLRDNRLMAQPFNDRTLQFAGDVFPVGVNATSSFNPGLMAVSATADGTLLYGDSRWETFQLAWKDRTGKEIGKVGRLGTYFGVALSPDNKTLAVNRQGDGIVLYELARDGETRLAPGFTPVWSPDGKRLAHSSANDLYLKEVNGAAKEEPVLKNANAKAPSDWSRDGSYLIYTEIDPKGRSDIWFMENPLDPQNGRKSTQFQATAADESQGQLSPDGRFLAYTSDESGRYEVYVRPFPTGAGRWKVSSDPYPGTHSEPRWRGDGRELYYEAGNAPQKWLMAVPVSYGPHGEFQAGPAVDLFNFNSVGQTAQGNLFLYSPSADGQRFLVKERPADDKSSVNVLTHWEQYALAHR
jgi:eukaryotic-like serine/threonine-protein kinase